MESWYLTELTSALDKLVRAMYPCTRGLWRSLRHSKPPSSLYLFLQQMEAQLPGQSCLQWTLCLLPADSSTLSARLQCTSTSMQIHDRLLIRQKQNNIGLLL